jgi:hypothetical protein
MDAVYCHLRDYEVREESKRKQEAIGKNYAVKLQSQQFTHSRNRKFAEKTLLKREDKKGILTIIKKAAPLLIVDRLNCFECQAARRHNNRIDCKSYFV